MDATEETLNLLNRLWAKLHGLPNATPVELGAFFVLLTFIGECLLLFIAPLRLLLKNEWLMTLFHWPSHSGGPAHDCADLRELLLLAQDEDEGPDHLSERSPCEEL